MALIKLGSFITQISGKVGGQTFGTSSSGSYVKNSGTTRKSITVLQRNKMSLMSTTSQIWRSLTDEERLVFNNASSEYPYLSRVGATKYYSGYAIFAQLYNNVGSTLGSSLPIPLPKISFTPLTNFVIDDSSGIAVSALGGQVGVMYRIFCTRPASPGITRPYKNHFYITQVTKAQLNSGFDISASFDAKFGALPLGTTFYCRVDAVHSASGQILKGIAQGQFVYT